jgi:hypothetical protein
VNTPIRARREVFKNALLDKIDWYTNNYGQLKAKRWQDAERKDLEAFICVLFVLPIQNRKDKPSNWFLEHHLLESPMIKKIISSRKFFPMVALVPALLLHGTPTRWRRL